MARENPRWGYFRIRRRALEARPTSRCDHDRLRAARCRVSAFWPKLSVDLEAIPDRARRDLVAADFFSLDTIFLIQLFVFIYVHLTSPKAATPNGADQPGRPAPESTTFTPLTRSHNASPSSAMKLTTSPG